MNLSGKVGSRPSISAPSAPPSPANPDLVDVDAQSRCHARIVHGGAQTAAESRLGKDILQQDRQDTADDNDEESIRADANTANLEALLQEIRNPHELLRRSEKIVDAGNCHEYETDGEKYLVQVRTPVQPPVERGFQHCAQ